MPVPVRIPTSRLVLTALAALGSVTAACKPAQAASYTFTTISGPAASLTYALGLNDVGQVVGYYSNATGSYGYLYTPGVANPFTTISGPAGATRVVAGGINNAGQIVGSYVSSYAGGGSVTHAFLFDSVSGQFTTLDAPGSLGFTSALGINNAGQIVGQFFPYLSSFPKAFLYTPGAASPFSTIVDPAGSTVSADGINGAGLIVGIYQDAALGAHGYLYNSVGGQFTTIAAPGATYSPAASGTDANGINDAGQIVGYYDSTGRTSGFLDIGGAFTTINVPAAGSYNTFANGINSAGRIVGFYNDGSGATYGFLASPNAVPEPSALVLLGLGLLPLGLVAARRRRA